MQKGQREMSPKAWAHFPWCSCTVFSLIWEVYFHESSKETWHELQPLFWRCISFTSLGPSDAWHNDHFSLENHVFLAFISIKWFLPLSICPATHGSFYLGSCPTLTSVDAKHQHTHATDSLTLYSPLWQSPTCFTPLRPCFSYLTSESLAHPLCLRFSPVLTDNSSLPQLWCLSSACLTQMGLQSSHLGLSSGGQLPPTSLGPASEHK